MRLKNRKFWGSLLCSAALVVAITGCESTSKKKPVPPVPTKPKTVEKVAPAPAPVPSTSYAWVGYPQPCPSADAAKILVEKEVPSKVKPNVPLSYVIKISNRADYAVKAISITETFPDGFKFLSSIPAPSSSKGDVSWEISSMQPSTQRIITVKGMATKTGAMRFAGKTKLNFDLGQMVSNVAIVEPNLEFKIINPEKVVISDIIPVKMTFTNSGKALLKGCKLVHTLPKGLLTSDGRSKIELVIGDLLPGKAVEKTIDLKAKKTGMYPTAFIAMADEGISANAMMKLEVTKPKLVISATAPAKRFVGNISPYRVTVKNTGNAVAKDTVIKLLIPEGLQVKTATENGTVTGNSVIWKINAIYPGETKDVSARVIAKKIMVVRAVAEAEAVAAEKVTTSLNTDVQGVAALITNLVDVNDPVPLGETEIYKITAKNTGSLPASRIVVKCILEDSMEFVKSDGATKSKLEGKTLVFERLAALEPQAEAEWRVVVKALKEGDVRFTVTVESDELERPVRMDESTHFYE